MATKVINTILNLKNASMLKGLSQVESSVGALQGKFKLLNRDGSLNVNGIVNKIDDFATKASIGVVTCAAAFTGFSAKVGTEFNSAFARVTTIADTSQKDLDTLKTEIMNLSSTTGIAATDLAGATYDAISATGDTAGSVSIVESATKLAKAGFADTGDALSVLTTAMNAYKMEAEDLTSVSDSLIQTQNLGVTTVGELSSVIGTSIATGSAYNVNLSNLESAYVSLTKNGINTAKSSTYINSMINELGKSSSGVAKTLQSETGKSFGELMNEGKSLADVLDILKGSVGGNSEAFANLWSNANAKKAASALDSQGLETFNNNLKTLQNSAGTTESAYSTMVSGFGGQMGILQAKVTNLGIDFWTNHLSGPATEAVTQLISTFDTLDFTALEESLAGVVTGGIDLLTNALTFLAEHGDQVVPTIQTVGTAILGLKGVTSVISTISMLASGFGTAKKIGSALFGVISAGNPVVTGLRIAMVVLPPIIMLIATHWKQVTAAVSNFINKHPALKKVLDGIKSGFNALKTAISTVKNAISSVIGIVGGLIDKLSSAWRWIGKVTGSNSSISSTINSASTSRSSAGSTTNASGSSYFSGGWTSINERGGEMAFLPGGSTIIPADKSAQLASAAGGGKYVINITVQGNIIGNEEYADQLGNYIVDKLAEVM